MKRDLKELAYLTGWLVGSYVGFVIVIHVLAANGWVKQ